MIPLLFTLSFLLHAITFWRGRRKRKRTARLRDGWVMSDRKTVLDPADLASKTGHTFVIEQEKADRDEISDPYGADAIYGDSAAQLGAMADASPARNGNPHFGGKAMFREVAGRTGKPT